jgi:hypothetical protein
MRVRNNGRSCRTGAPILVCVMLFEVVPPKHRLNPEISARMRTMTALRQFRRTSLPTTQLHQPHNSGSFGRKRALHEIGRAR